jgi:hypothetical protein
VHTDFKLVTGKRLLYRPVTGTTELVSIGIARATKGDETPAGEKFCEILRKTSAARAMPDRWEHQSRSMRRPLTTSCPQSPSIDR